MYIQYMHFTLMTKLIFFIARWEDSHKKPSTTQFFSQTCFDAKFSIWGDHHGSKLARSLQVDHDYIPNLIIVLDLLWGGWVKDC